MNNYHGALLLVTLFVFGVGLNGQMNYKNAYIITSENDTIYGLINDGGGYMNSRVCLYKENKKSEPIRYYPGDIKAYRFIGDKYYSTKEVLINSKYIPVFTDVLIEGKVNLYHHWRNEEMSFYLEKESGNPIGLLYKKAVIPVSSDSLKGLAKNEGISTSYSAKYSNQNHTSVNIEYFKDTLRSIFANSDAALNQLETLKYKQKSMQNITRTYINETCEGNDCILYEKDLNKTKPFFGILSGVQLSKINFWASTVRTDTTVEAFQSPLESDMVPSVRFGILYNIPVSMINDRLSLQFELTANSIIYNQGTIRFPNYPVMKLSMTTVSLPVLLKYTIPKRIASPAFAVGKETSFIVNSYIYDPKRIDPEDPNGGLLKQVVHKNQRGGWFLEAGLSYKLGKNISMFSNIRVQTSHNMIVSKSHEYNTSNQLTFARVLEYKFYEHRFRSNFAGLHIGFTF